MARKPGTAHVRDTSVATTFAVGVAAVDTVVHYRTVDLTFNDETVYLESGLKLLSQGLPTAENAPLYSVWYWLESLLVTDPIALYYFNWGLLLLASLLCVITLARTVGIGLAGTVAITSLVSILGYFRVWPYVSLPAGILVLLAALVALRRESTAVALAQGGLLLFLAAYFRPELTLAAALYLGVAAVCAVRERVWKPLAISIGACLLLLLVLGLPVGGGRSLLAFAQHYAVNVVASRGLTIDPWSKWEQIFRADFGAAASPRAALMSNPVCFLWHIGFNAKQFWRTSYFATVHIPSSFALKFVSGLFSVGLLAAGCFAAAKIYKRDRRLVRILLLVASTLVPAVISALVIHPRLHYLTAPFMATVALAIAAAGLSKTKTSLLPRRVWWLALPAGAALVLCVAVAAVQKARGRPMPGRGSVEALKSLNLREPELAVLDADAGRLVYARLEYKLIDHGACTPFAECLRSRQPNLVISDTRLQTHYSADAGFAQFVQQPAASGFAGTAVPGTNVVVYSRP